MAQDYRPTELGQLVHNCSANPKKPGGFENLEVWDLELGAQD